MKQFHLDHDSISIHRQNLGQAIEYLGEQEDATYENNSTIASNRFRSSRAKTPTSGSVKRLSFAHDNPTFAETTLPLIRFDANIADPQ